MITIIVLAAVISLAYILGRAVRCPKCGSTKKRWFTNQKNKVCAVCESCGHAYDK
jgi:uncharacterized protein (DUF983 family)